MSYRAFDRAGSPAHRRQRRQDLPAPRVAPAGLRRAKILLLRANVVRSWGFSAQGSEHEAARGMQASVGCLHRATHQARDLTHGYAFQLVEYEDVALVGPHLR